MYLSSITIVTLISVALASPQDVSADGLRKPGQCPQIWTQISKDLSGMFISGGQCNDDARSAIRATFHDCFPDGGCDGSLALPAELSRRENVPMTGTVNKLADLAKQRNVSVADMLAYAGSHAVVSCPGGPIVPTFIGRKDATSSAPEAQLPRPDAAGDASLQAFQARGFSATDLGALIGAHTAAKQFTVDPTKVGTPTDSTPGVWDILYYAQTLLKRAPFSFQSDINLVNQAQVGPVMKRFSVDKFGWDAAFASAMAKMEMLGGNKANMVDCTSTLPRAHFKRDAAAAGINARALRA